MYVNGEFVDDELVRVEAARMKEALQLESMAKEDPLELEIQARDLAREWIIEQTLLRQAAARHPELVSEQDVESEVQAYYRQNPQQAGCLLARDREGLRNQLETDLRVERYLALLSAHIGLPSKKQSQEIYRSTKHSLKIPAAVHAAHIVKNVDELRSETAALTEIRKIQNLLEEGLPFERAADEYSDCPGRGGDLGFFTRGEMVAEFEEQVFDLAIGALSPIFRTEFGFHIARVLERRAERIPLFEEVYEQLQQSLWEEQKGAAVRQAIRDMRRRAEIRKSK